MKTVRIGNGAGFWGDSLDAPRRLVAGGRLDYLTLEYLAELTMSILAHQRSRDPQAGFVTDFAVVLESLLASLSAKQTNTPELRIVTNAGGTNPAGCACKSSQLLASAGLNDVLVATVTGDDLGGDLESHLAAGETFAHFETGESFDRARDQVVSAHAYLGAAGIVEALAQGAQIVITGRVADAALTVGPAVYEFGWDWDDWQRLAAATVAGHLIECGAQATGGIYSDWTPDISLAQVGYPVVELFSDGSFTIAKPPGSGGEVSVGTVSEQLVYEIGDPAHYLTPDVDADFSQVRLIQEATDCVRVDGARGSARPERYKVSMAYHDGFTASGMLVLAGRGAVERARIAAEIVFERVRQAGFSLEETHVECLGAGDTACGLWPSSDPPEVVLRLSARDPSRASLERFVRELAPLVTAGPPGVTGYTGARAKPRPVLAYWPTSIARTRVKEAVTVKRARDWIA